MEVYDDLYNQLVCYNDRRLLDRIVFIDFNFIESISKEKTFIHFIGPIMDNTYIHGYYSYVFFEKKYDKDFVKKRLDELFFENAIPIEISKIKELTNLKNVATLCTKRTYSKLKKMKFKSYFFVLH